MRKLTAIFAATILALHLSACTSSDSKEDGTEDGAVAESTEGTDADLQNLDAPPADNAVASKDGANEGFLDEQLPEDALGESNKTAAAEPPPAEIADNSTPPPSMEEPPKSEPAVTQAAPIETPSDTSVAAVDTGTTSSTEPSSNLSDASTGAAAATTSSSEPSMTEPAPESKPKVSLQKIESAPIHREGILLNAVYIARPGDNYKKISKMIYGSEDKAKELKKVNPSVKPRVGDKIYYNSPVRPADDTKMMTYYEDAGLVPDVYVAQEGDNLKKVSKKLLGHKDAWKEIWATNMIDSKDALPAGTELRYWKSAPTQTVAAAPEVAPPAEGHGKTDVAMNNPPPEMAPPPTMPENPPQNAMPDMPAPPPAPDMHAATPPPPDMAPPPPPQPVAEQPPPPPPQEMAPPPPPPPPDVAPPPPPSPVVKKAPQNGETGGMDNDMIMSLAGAGIIAVGLAAMIIVRKRRQNRDMAQAFNDTQVGT
jgi:LPXTG-motif cell wall-anchored protein